MFALDGIAAISGLFLSYNNCALVKDCLAFISLPHCGSSNTSSNTFRANLLNFHQDQSALAGDVAKNPVGFYLVPLNDRSAYHYNSYAASR